MKKKMAQKKYGSKKLTFCCRSDWAPGKKLPGRCYFIPSSFLTRGKMSSVAAAYKRMPCRESIIRE